MVPAHRTRLGAAASLVLLLGLVATLAACSGRPDTSADEDDGVVPHPLVTSTAYVGTTLRVNYHTDLIVFVSPTAGSDQFREIEQAVEGLDVRSALLITSDRAYDEARCLLAGHSGVLDTLPKELVGSQFRLDFGGDQAKILAARLQLQNLSGVAQITGGEDLTGGPAATTPGAGVGAAASSTTTTANGPTAAAAAPTQCQAEGIRVK